MKKLLLSFLVIVISLICVCCENSNKTELNVYDLTVVLNGFNMQKEQQQFLTLQITAVDL